MADAARYTSHLSISVDDLDAAREFYEVAFGCRVGRVRADFVDVWFFGMQLTLQRQPEATTDPQTGDRHFGVAFRDRDDYVDVVGRLNRYGVQWLEGPVAHAAADLSGKEGGKLADPSGNVIEVKYYEEPSTVFE